MRRVNVMKKRKEGVHSFNVGRRIPARIERERESQEKVLVSLLPALFRRSGEADTSQGDKTFWPNFARERTLYRHTPEYRQANLRKHFLRCSCARYYKHTFDFFPSPLSNHFRCNTEAPPPRPKGNPSQRPLIQDSSKLRDHPHRNTMQLLLYVLAFLGLALATSTNNYNATTPPAVTATATITHASTFSSSTSSSASSSAPLSTHCPILIENDPWLLTNITLFHPSPPPYQNHTNSTSSSSSSSAFISFHFRDTNKGLELETRCFRTFPKHSKTNPVTYYPCEDGRVRFAYAAAGEEEEGELKVGRGRRDDW